MNCKPGDLAVIVSVGNAWGLALKVARACLGRIVTVTKLTPPSGNYEPKCSSNLVWNFAEPFVVTIKGEDFLVLGTDDACLRPLRDRPGEDETLTWLPIPQEPEHAL